MDVKFSDVIDKVETYLVLMSSNSGVDFHKFREHCFFLIGDGVTDTVKNCIRDMATEQLGEDSIYWSERQLNGQSAVFVDLDQHRPIHFKGVDTTPYKLFYSKIAAYEKT